MLEKLTTAYNLTSLRLPELSSFRIRRKDGKHRIRNPELKLKTHNLLFSSALKLIYVNVALEGAINE
jgi:hypothetical protein